MSDPTRGGAAKTIYKIFRIDEWSSAQRASHFAGSPDDMRDGFIHFSTAEQLRGTLETHFSAESEIIIAAIDVAALGSDLKWEASREGRRFPHLYASLPLHGVSKVTRYARDGAGEFLLPAEFS